LRPLETGSGRRGVGLTFATGASDVQSRSWNVDVFTSWTVYKAFALYGRLGYAQSETVPLAGMAPVSISAARGLRDGINYRVGVRNHINSTQGQRHEYNPIGRFPREIGTSLPRPTRSRSGCKSGSERIRDRFPPLAPLPGGVESSLAPLAALEDRRIPCATLRPPP
jgi:hypothetical protein